MEGEKERQRQQGEEKESNEAEDDRRSDEDADNEEEEEEDSECAALVWQEGYGEDNLGLPIMHWEALSLRIAELEKQEEENKEKRAKVSGCYLGEGGLVLGTPTCIEGHRTLLVLVRTDAACCYESFSYLRSLLQTKLWIRIRLITMRVCRKVWS